MKKIPPGCMLPGRGASDHLIVFRFISEIKLKLRTTNVRDYLRIKHYRLGHKDIYERFENELQKRLANYKLKINV